MRLNFRRRRELDANTNFFLFFARYFIGKILLYSNHSICVIDVKLFWLGVLIGMGIELNSELEGTV